MTIDQYIKNINGRFERGNATEHTYRGDLQQLLESIVPGIAATNEPQRISCGAPDYILTKKDIPVGYIEAKAIGENLKDKLFKEQFDRYRASLDNLIITDYIDFHFYVDGEYTTGIQIAEFRNGKLIPLPKNLTSFETLIKDFCMYQGQSIKSPNKLAEMMAAKARMLADVIEKALNSDEDNQEDSSLKEQFLAFKQVLIHDIQPKEFADVYAQTIAYGMFAARLHDTSLDTFTRQEAATLIPKTNPFLRKLFQYVAGYDLDSRISWIVDGLADVFRATDVAEILKNFGSATHTQDPIIHFYETFLSSYDPALRKARGVWYTPEPVVNFIVRAIDDILKIEFGFEDGLADNSMTTIKVNVPGIKNSVDKQVHRLQFLDPATGTATFIAEFIKQIFNKFKGQEGIWSDYVEKHLIPRLNGFEILMASYAMAHLKLDLLLKATGYLPKKEQRFRIYLTNSLEEFNVDTGTLFSTWLSAEANEANQVKRDTPVMVVAGNPPYSGESSNKGEWIMSLMEDYKKEPGGKEKLKERNPKWINDDYVKFIRYGQHFIEKNGEGILAFINPHGFLDNPTFRGMRWNLLKTYDKIYTIDLHGNSKKKETAPDGSIDQNVFDIMQGVSINLFIKTGKKKAGELGKVFHFDLYGKREMKYDFLYKNSLNTIEYKELPNVSPNYFFVEKNFNEQKGYDNGFSVNALFRLNGTGIVSKRDSLAFQDTKPKIMSIVKDIFDLSFEGIKQKFNRVSWESRDGKVEFCKQNVMEFGLNENLFVQCEYRPFDKRWTYYTGKTKGFIGWPVKQVMQHFLKGENVGLALCKQFKSGETYQHVLITKNITECSFVSNKTSEITSIFPLYLYPEINGQQTIEPTLARTPNLDTIIVQQIAVKLNITFTAEKEQSQNTFSPVDILDYIYAVLHSIPYREKYKEFLKIDFPRIPYPKDTTTFWQLVAFGSELRQIHLLESPVLSKYLTKYPIAGDNIVGKINYHEQKAYINDTQYFANVPQVAWNFYIGGYQPAQKWLKDRKERVLEFDDILHYQKIIVALTETDRLMTEINKIEIE